MIEQLFKHRESPPPGFLSRLEEATRRAYREERRARRARRRAALTAGALLAAAVPLVLWLEQPKVKVAPITAEKLAPKTAEPRPEQPRTPEAEPRPAVVDHEPTPSARAPVPSVKPRPPALGQDLAVLASVRRLLQDGQAKQALAVLNRHRAQLQAGQLRREAEVLRLETLSRLGQRREASDRARVFIEENPNSPLVDRARSYVID